MKVAAESEDEARQLKAQPNQAIRGLHLFIPLQSADKLMKSIVAMCQNAVLGQVRMGL